MVIVKPTAVTNQMVLNVLLNAQEEDSGCRLLAVFEGDPKTFGMAQIFAIGHCAQRRLTLQLSMPDHDKAGSPVRSYQLDFPCTYAGTQEALIMAAKCTGLYLPCDSDPAEMHAEEPSLVRFVVDDGSKAAGDRDKAPGCLDQLVDMFNRAKT